MSIRKEIDQCAIALDLALNKIRKRSVKKQSLRSGDWFGCGRVITTESWNAFVKAYKEQHMTTEPKPKNESAVSLGKLGAGKSRSISPEERVRRQGRAAHARAAKALKALAQAEGNGQ